MGEVMNKKEEFKEFLKRNSYLSRFVNDGLPLTRNFLKHMIYTGKIVKYGTNLEMRNAQILVIQK